MEKTRSEGGGSVTSGGIFQRIYPWSLKGRAEKAAALKLTGKRSYVCVNVAAPNSVVSACGDKQEPVCGQTDRQTGQRKERETDRGFVRVYRRLHPFDWCVDCDLWSPRR